MPKDKMNVEDVEALVKIAEEYGLEELAVTDGGLSVVVRNEPEPALVDETASAPVARGAPRARPRKKAEPRATQPAAPSASLSIVCPMTGVFYRSPAPDAPAFVEVGDVVAVGQTVGLIEAMKVFSEVPAEVGGKVVAIVVDNGHLVQADAPLYLLEPASEAEVV